MRNTGTIAAMSAAALMVISLGGIGVAQSDDDVMNATEPETSMDDGLTVEGVWSRPSAAVDGVAAAYMTLRNSSDVDEVFITAASPAAGAVELHETTEDAEGMMSMSPVASITVPAGGDVVLEPGGYHLMLVDLPEPLAEGDSVDLTLVFQNAGAVQVTSTVMAMDATGPMDSMTADEPVVEELPTSFTVEALDNFYQPKTITAPANTEITVKLLNYGFLPHNIAFYVEEGGALLADGALTPVIDPETEAKVTFTTPGPGEYFILCVIHPEMTGTLIVK